MTTVDKRVRIATDIELRDVLSEKAAITHLYEGPYRGSRDWYKQVTAADVAIFRLPSKRSLSYDLSARLGSRRLHVVYYDVNVPVVSNTWSSLKRSAFFLQLRSSADLILTLQADTREYSRLTGIPLERFRYVGFKSNAWEDTESVTRGRETEDQGAYVIACGRSYRDFQTFAKAIEMAEVPGRILMTQGDARAEGTIIPERIPPNLEIVPHDGTRAGWVDAILGAKVVTVPIRIGVHQPAGISVYLESMNLSRPVVVTEGASTRGMLDDWTAGIPPAGDAEAMAREIRRLWADDGLRARRIRAGRDYVATLGGMDRMSEAILTEALSLARTSVAPTRKHAA